MKTATAQRDLLTLLSRHVLPVYGALRLSTLYEALKRACHDLLGCERVTIVTFQGQSPRARLRFTSEPDLAGHTGRLVPFDDGALSDSLRAGYPNEAGTEGPLVWRPPDGSCVVSAQAVRPLVFEGETYGGLLFHDIQRPTNNEEGQDAEPGLRTPVFAPPIDLTMDLIAEALGVALMKCQLDEERASQVVGSRVRLAAITRMGRALNSLDLEVLLQRMMDVALSAVNGQVGSIVLARDSGKMPSDSGGLETVIEWGLKHDVAAAIHYNDRTVMEEVYETRLPILLTDVPHDERVRVDRHDVAIESYLCVPLYTSRGALGVLNLINSSSGDAFSDRDIDLLLTISNLASAALENALLHEAAIAKERMEAQLDIAGGIQKGLLPSSAPSLPGLDLAGWNHPCEAVGGDYFDFLPLADGRTAIVIGDVSGHGVGPALLMSSARAALRSFVACQIGPDDIMVRLNRLLTEQVLTPGTFITMIVAIVDATDRRLTFTNAGHPPPLVLNTLSLSIREPLERGLVLGVDVEADYPVSPAIVLGAGDIVALYTDGILDATNADGECFGKNRLTKTLVANRNRPARGIIDAIRAEVHSFCDAAPPADDLTLVLIKALDGPGRAGGRGRAPRSGRPSARW